MDTEANAALLKERGLKITNPRLAVLEIFQKSKARHLSAEDVYKEAWSRLGICAEAAPGPARRMRDNGVRALIFGCVSFRVPGVKAGQ